ncbi:UPF0149 family protein [Pseudorhodoferax sp. Leaf274]|uniref:UPF0149 family protein n=1 Tax=Pseudorhodoferax sp. Leaf274 TaxID=1736318 RepID=UPI001F2C6FBB|nr:UPF0149 family protein [Pseudorhodoferax sp. Leaf274]
MLQPEDFDQLDAWLDILREQGIDAPQWELCEGFMAALVCCRSPVAPADYWPVLLESEKPLEELFPDAAVRQQFEAMWARRWQEVATALDAEVDSLDDERAYCPQVLDVRSAMAQLEPAARAEALGLEQPEAAALAEAQAQLPSFAQLWALGFMLVVETWPDEWLAPSREKDIARAMDDALGNVAELCEDDEGPHEVSAYVDDDGQEGPPSMSADRLEAFGEAVWAVYDLRAAGLALGPRVAQVRHDAPAPGRNDACPCGSGKKFKKCHGAD